MLKCPRQLVVKTLDVLLNTTKICMRHLIGCSEYFNITYVYTWFAVYSKKAYLNFLEDYFLEKKGFRLKSGGILRTIQCGLQNLSLAILLKRAIRMTLIEVKICFTYFNRTVSELSHVISALSKVVLRKS